MDILILLSLAPWFLFLYLTYKSYRSLKPLNHFSVTNSNKSLSVVIATKDSEEDIALTLDKLIKTQYSQLEIIVVNDRSSDHTEKIIEEIAVTHNQVIPVHIRELPTGWLGKVNAMNEGLKKCSGDYVLFMDGDVLIGKDHLEQAVNLMEEQNLDHLTLMPNIPCPTFFLKLLVLTSQLLFTLSNRAWLSIEERPLKCVKGIGPFNLVRRSHFEKTEGFKWLKLDISDDVALSHLVAKNGGRSLYVKANSDGPTFPWYKDAIHMMRGLEKNIVGGFTNYKLSLFLIVSFFASLPVIIPALSLVLTLQGSTLSLIALTFFLLSTILFAIKVKPFTHHSLMPLFFFPLGILQLNLVMIRAGILLLKNGGIFWSGTFYPLKDLKKGLRVRLGL